MSEKISLQTLKYIYTVTTSNQNGITGQSTSQQGPTSALTDSVVYGSNIPNWRRVIAEGGNATTNLNGVKWVITRSPAAFTARETFSLSPLQFNQTTVNGDFLYLGNSIPQHAINSEAVSNNQALVRFYRNVAASQARFKGLVFAGELPSALRMIQSPAKALRRGIDHYLSFLKRGGRLSRRDRPSFVRESWLEYAFGWRPLIKDIDDAIDEFYRSKHVRPIFEMVSGMGSFEIRSLTPVILPLGSGSTASYSVLSVAKHSSKYWGVSHSAGNGSVNNHHYGFVPHEIIPTIYELIPYSFLVDYFTNIGEIVQSWSYRFIRTAWLSHLLHSTLSSETVGVFVTDLSAQHPSRRYTFSGSVGSAKVEKTSFTRTRSVGFELPKFEVRAPGFDSRWVNILALSKKLDITRKILAK